jgi:hypothetical protein
MTKQISKGNRVYDQDGLHAIELMEIALEHPIWFAIICILINCNLKEGVIRWVLKRIV